MNGYDYHNNIRAQHQLSEAERKTVNSLGNPLLIEAMETGDEAYRKGNIIDEAIDHRFVQDEFKRMKMLHKDEESLIAFSYNSAIIHKKKLVEKGLAQGMLFNDMFNLQINNKPKPGQRKYEYNWKVPESVIPTYGLYNNSTPQNNYQSNYHNNNYNNYFNSLQSNGFSKETNDLVNGLQRMFGHI